MSFQWVGLPTPLCSSLRHWVKGTGKTTDPPTWSLLELEDELQINFIHLTDTLRAAFVCQALFRAGRQARPCPH